MTFARILMATVVSMAITGCAAPGKNSSTPVVKTEGGPVRGSGDKVQRYLGIPYAAAPVGALRWRAPQPAETWQGVRDATSFGSYCVQPQEYSEMRGTMSEDCLNLNVWTPSHAQSDRLPVIVWIHGGGFSYGGGAHPSYDGEALATRGIIVVTLNYRLGLLGFMAHPQLSAESASGSSGNYGLMDQVAALKWVQRNIAAFGGDPSRVTVMGQSAGAHAISALMTSKQAEGTFQQAIMQSVGVMRPQLPLHQAEQFGLKVGADIAQLRSLPAEQFVGLQKSLGVDRNLVGGRPVSIINDGALIDRPDYAAFSSGQFSRVPILVGNVANEGGGATRNWPVNTTADFRALLARTFKGQEARAYVAFPAQSDADVKQALSDLYSDTQFLFGTRELLNAYEKQGLTSYRYVFSRHRDESSAAPIHGDDLQYVFDNLGAPHRGKRRPFNAVDAAVAKSMADAWVRFAKTGDPNGPGLPSWPAYTNNAKAFMDFDTQAVARRGYDGRGIDFVSDYFRSVRR